MSSVRATITVIAASALVACAYQTPAPNSELRIGLTYYELAKVEPPPSGPVDNALFMPTKNAEKALHSFSATLVIPEHAMRTTPAAIEPAKIAGKMTQLFPALRLSFVDDNGYLVPLRRDIMVAPEGESYWQIQVEPGRVWSEPGDRGMSRASFPFLLTSNKENETYNGVATFLYCDKEISELRYQIIHQTSPYLVQTFFEASGQIGVGYDPTVFKDARRVKAQFKRELADRWPVHNWAELQKRFGDDALEGFDSGIDPAKNTASGLIIDGEIFVRSMATPYGDYPYPNEMRHGVWSVTKSAAGLLTMLRLAEKYGDEIFDYKIKDYLNVTAPHDGWNDVTIGHALSMATGIGTGSTNVNPNEIEDGYIVSDQDAYDAWYLVASNIEKQEHLFRVANHPWGPGEHVRYRDRDIYVLAAALDAFLKSKEGPDADLWHLMMKEVYEPIGIHHLPMNRTKEPHHRPGVPLLAWGMYLTLDDTAKIGTLLQNGGRHNGVQLLSASKLAESLYETNIRGLPTGESNQYGKASYHMTWWHYPYRSISGQQTSIAQMVGWGGNVISLIPNGMIGFRFGNGGYLPLEGFVPVADRLRPIGDD